MVSLEQARAAIAAALGTKINLIGEQDNLIQWGLDSIKAMGLVNSWRRDGVKVTLAELVEQPTLAHWSAVLASKGVKHGGDGRANP